MRASLLFILFIQIQLVFSQEVPDPIFSVNVDLGINDVMEEDVDLKPFGIDLIESNTQPGFYGSIGIDVKYPEKLNTEVKLFYAGLSISQENFKRALENRFSPNEVLFDNHPLFGNGLTGSGFTGYSMSMSYRITFKKMHIKPGLTFGNQRVIVNDYSFVLREKQTNYFTEYLIESQSNKRFFYSLNVNVYLNRLPDVGFFTRVGNNSVSTDYTISIEDRFSNVEIEEFSSNYTRWFWSCGFILRLNSRSMEEVER